MLTEKFLTKILPEPNSGCWIWMGAIMSNGYGVAQYKRRNILAHRLSYLLFREPIPKNLQLDHLCRVRSCVNPQHLEAVTCAENLPQGVGQLPHAFCRRGHPMTPDNLVYDNKRVRRCKTCAYLKNRRWSRQNAHR